MCSLILISLDECDGYLPTYPPGLFVKPSELKVVIDGLIEYTNAYSDAEIEKINEEKQQESFRPFTKTKKPNKRGYVYLFKCADKYKIGYSKNVEQRLQQLDVRPFKLNLIFKVYSENAYDIEQELHKRLDGYREISEWYSDITEGMIKDMIIEIARYLQCDIQF